MWHEGVFTYKQINGSDGQNLIGWTWELSQQGALVVVNYSDKKQQGSVKLDVQSGLVTF